MTRTKKMWYRNQKRLLAALLTISMALALAPQGVIFAADDVIEVRTGTEFTNALKNVNSGGTISLMADIDGVSSSTISKNTFIVEGNGHTITQTGSSAPIRIKEGHVTVRNTIFQGNEKTSTLKYGGGAIASYKANVTIENCAFLNHTASGSSYGGGAVMQQKDGTLNVYNSTFHGNRATGGDGGAIYAGNNANIVNCTIVGNTAKAKGGGVRAASSSKVTLLNTIVIDNSASSSSNGPDVYRANDGGYNLIGDSKEIVNTSSTSIYDVTNSGWLADTPANNGGNTLTMALLPVVNSPAIDKGGSGSLVPATDQRGFPRDSHPDIGAYEYYLVKGSVVLEVGQVYDLSEIEGTSGLFETVDCEDGWEQVILFDPDNHGKIKAVGPGSTVIHGYIDGNKYLEVTVTVSSNPHPNQIKKLNILSAPESIDSEVWFTLPYTVETTGNISKEAEYTVTKKDGSPLPDHVVVEAKEGEGIIQFLFVNEQVQGAYFDVDVMITLKAKADFTVFDTVPITLKKPKETAVIGVDLKSSTSAMDSEESATLTYNVLSPDGFVDDPRIKWNYTASSGIAIQGLSQDQITDQSSGRITIQARNRTSNVGTLKITATSVSNPYRTATVKIAVTGVKTEVRSYDELYRAIYAANDGDLISIEADLIAKKVTFADGTSSASIHSATRSLQSAITVNDNVIIEGNGHTIDGQGYYAIFYGVQGKLTLKNLTITNAYNTNTSSSEKQGVAICLKGGDLYMENVTVYGCESSVGNGGAVYASDNSNIHIKNCTFINNKGRYGGGIYIDKATATIENSIIFNNRADKGGDDVGFSSNANINDAGYNIIYDVYDYSTSTSNPSFHYHETTSSKQNLDVYAYEWISSALGQNGGGAKTVALLKSEQSPAIDRIPEGLYPDKDERGIPRTGLGDIGAYEYYGIEKSYTLAVGDKILVDDDYTADAAALLVLDAVATWTTSSRAVATVDSGYITAQQGGTAVIQGFDDSGSSTAVFQVYVGTASIASVEIASDISSVESGEVISLSYEVRAGVESDTSLTWEVLLFEEDGWDQYHPLPEGVSVIGVTNTSERSGNMKIEAVNRTGEEVILSLQAVSDIDPSKRAEQFIAVKPEHYTGIDLSANNTNVMSGEAVKITYALDASPSILDKRVTWQMEADDMDIIGAISETDQMHGSWILSFINLTDQRQEAMITVYGAGDIEGSVIIDVEPVKIDGISGATILNTGVLAAMDPYPNEAEILVYYALGDDVEIPEITWTFLQCDPEDHDVEYELQKNVAVSADAGTGYITIGSDEEVISFGQYGVLKIQIHNEAAKQIAIVLKGTAEVGDFDFVSTGYHFHVNEPNITGVIMSRETISLKVGNESRLTAAVLPNTADQSVVWSSLNNGIATVDSNGLIRGVKEGSTVILATTPDGKFGASCEVIVTGNSKNNGGGGSASVKEDAKKEDAGEMPLSNPEGNKNSGLSLSNFRDLNASAWYYEPVGFVVEKGLFSGISDDSFVPNGVMTRAMFVTVLGRVAEQMGISTTGYNGNFNDVRPNSWYSDYVAWASSNGIMNGYDRQTFGVDDSITREQMATILIRFADFAEINLKLGDAKGFTDAAAFRPWADAAIVAASSSGLLNGYEDGSFRPEKTATRAEVATVFQNFIEEYGKE